MGNAIVLFIIAYLLGSIPFGKLIAWYGYKTDIQRRGSGNIGFANVRRILGWRAGIVTLAGDAIKGIIPVSLALQYVPDYAFWTGITAILGHIFPVWLNFRGGKGIATGLGVLIALAPLAALVGASCYIVGGLLKYRSSTASLAGLFAATATGVYCTPSTWWHYAILLAIALWTLRHNLTGRVPSYDT